MKKSLIITYLVIAWLSAGAQNKPVAVNTEDILRKVADRIVANTSFKFINKGTGEQMTSLQGNKPTPDVVAESSYNKWGYPNGVMMTGLMHMSVLLKDQKYQDYCLRNYRFIFDNLPYFEGIYNKALSSNKSAPVRTEFAGLFKMGNLDNCGAMAAGLCDVYDQDRRQDYRAYLDRAGHYVLNEQMRLSDGTLCRPEPRRETVWADDLYMSVPFLARMGKVTGDKKYFDDAVKQILNFKKHLYDPQTGLFYHCYYNSNGENGVAHWGRANGWVAVAQTELLNYLPKDHPKRKQLIDLLLQDITGFSRWQDQSGLWHQLLDKSDSYLETSATAMYVYTIARAVNEGWIEKGYINVARTGWNALANKITPDGQMPEVCVGTGIQEDLRFYYNRPVLLNDTHGLGAFLLAGSEMLRYEGENPPKNR
jgi:unsaturated rhamnogalacturonyl hydrolase